MFRTRAPAFEPPLHVPLISEGGHAELQLLPHFILIVGQPVFSIFLKVDPVGGGPRFDAVTHLFLFVFSLRQDFAAEGFISGVNYSFSRAGFKKKKTQE